MHLNIISQESRSGDSTRVIASESQFGTQLKADDGAVYTDATSDDVAAADVRPFLLATTSEGIEAKTYTVSPIRAALGASGRLNALLHNRRGAPPNNFWRRNDEIKAMTSVEKKDYG